MTVLVALWLGRIVEADLASRRIPNVLLWPGVGAVAASALAQPHLAAAAAITAAPYLAGWLTRRVGGGDVKLAAVLGGLVGDWRTGLLMVALASAVTLIGHAVTRRAEATAHAPALAAATVVCLALPT
ncbi:hypothetical protein GCM10009624_11170 [Gordonia sinesedis]